MKAVNLYSLMKVCEELITEILPAFLRWDGADIQIHYQFEYNGLDLFSTGYYPVTLHLTGFWQYKQ